MSRHTILLFNLCVPPRIVRIVPLRLARAVTRDGTVGCDAALSPSTVLAGLMLLTLHCGVPSSHDARQKAVEPQLQGWPFAASQHKKHACGKRAHTQQCRRCS